MSKKFTQRGLLLLAVMLVLSISIVPAFAQDAPSGTVVVSHRAASAWVRNFNPFAPDPINDVHGLIYEPLLVWNEVDGSGTPWLASDFAWSEDLMTLTATLREGVQWTDGEAFTADDVVFTLELIKNFPELDRASLWTFLDSVEAVDDYTVNFNMSRVYTLADTLLGEVEVVPEHIWSAIEDPVTFTNEDPVATGPFSIVCTFEDQVFELCANPNYWGEGPFVERLRYPAFPGNEQSSLAMVNGEVDWAGHFIPDIESTYVAADPEHHKFFFWPGGGTVQLYMNTTKAPFSDLEFRKAISQAIDYSSVVEIGMYGYTIPANATGLGPRYDSWVDQAALDKAAEMGLGVYSPETAAATLDAAGYADANGDGWRDNLDGSDLTFNIQAVNGWTDWVTSIQIIVQNLQEIGLNAQVATPEFGDWMNNLQLGTYDISISWSSSGRTPWNFYRGIMQSSLIGADGRANAETWSRWVSPESDVLIDAFVATADEAEQKDIINQLQMFFVENVVAVPLFPGPAWYEWNDARFTGFPTAEDYYTQGSPWDRDSNSRLLIATRIRPVGGQ